MVSIAKRIRKQLDSTPDITAKECSEILKIPYSKSFNNNFYRVKTQPLKTIKEKVINNELSISSTKKQVKDQFHDPLDFTIDKDLEHFEGVELIKHFSEKAIKNKLLTTSDRLKALQIYVQYHDKAGKIKEDADSENKMIRGKLRQLSSKELVQLLRKTRGSSNLPSEKELEDKDIMTAKAIKLKEVMLGESKLD